MSLSGPNNTSRSLHHDTSKHSNHIQVPGTEDSERWAPPERRRFLAASGRRLWLMGSRGLVPWGRMSHCLVGWHILWLEHGWLCNTKQRSCFWNWCFARNTSRSPTNCSEGCPLKSLGWFIFTITHSFNIETNLTAYSMLGCLLHCLSNWLQATVRRRVSSKLHGCWFVDPHCWVWIN